MLLKRISKFFICTIITASLIVQCGCSALNFRYEYDRGMKAYNEKNYDEAVIYFNNALNYKPDSYSALCLLGTSYAYKKETQLAEKTFQDAIRLFPNQWNAYVLLGDIKRNQKKTRNRQKRRIKTKTVNQKFSIVRLVDMPL